MFAKTPLFRPTSAAWAAMSVLLGASTALVAAPDVTATKDDGVAAATKLPAGSNVTYQNTITNNGSSDATGVQFIDPEVANTAYVSDSLTATPVAIDDVYPVTVIANSSINTATSGFSVIANDFAGYSGGTAVANTALTISNVTTPAHGTVSMTLSGAGVGQFIYTPTPGYTGADSFTYEISNGVTGGTTISKTGTVNLTVGGPVIWFVDPNQGSNGTGILGNSFNNLAAAVTAIGANTNHRIFIYSGGAAQTTGTVLNSGAWLVGQAAVGTNFETLMGGISYPGDTTTARPSINHPTKPSLTRSNGNTLTLGENNLILGVAIGNTGSGVAISGSNINAGQIGNSVTSDVDLSSGGSSLGVISLGGGNGNIAINAPISCAAGRSVNISSRSGGVVSFPKSITDTGTGIALASNTNATIAFSGGLALSTGSSTAFSATGGGKISATQNNSSIVNTITTSTGTGLVVTNTTIDTPGLTFRSIAVNGAANGIVLNNTGTSAGLTVTANATTNSGGIIQNTTGDGISLTNTMSPSFARMRVENTGGQGISGMAVNGFTLTDSTIFSAGNGDEENGIIFGSSIGADNGITGTVLIQDVTIDGPEQWGLRVRNAAAGTTNMTLRRLLVQNNTGTFGEDAVSIRIEGGNSVVLVDDCDFIDTGGKGVDGQCGGNSSASLHMTVKDSQFLRNLALPFAISFTTQGNASGRFLGSGNTATSSTTDITSSMAFDFDASDTSTLHATMTNNTASVTFGTGLEFVVNDNAIGRISATGNTINLDPGNVNASAQQGMNFHARSVLTSSSTGQLHVTLGNNTITGITSALFGFAGINFQSGSSSGSHAQTISLNVSSSNGAGGNSVSGTTGSAFNLRQRTGTTFRVTGLAAAGTSESNVQSFIQTNNSSGSLGGATVVAGAGGTTIVNYTSGTTDAPQTPTLPLLLATGGVERETVRFAASPAVTTSEATANQETAMFEIKPAAETGIVSQEELNAVVLDAIQRWKDTGITIEQVRLLNSMKFEIAELDRNRLGEAGGNTIRVDDNAGGNGWFVDGSAASDDYFNREKSSTRRYTEPSGVPAGRVDLLTTVMHEMGHALGLPDSYHSADRDSIMYGHLSKGERRLPAADEAKDAVPFAGAATHYLSGALNPIDIGTLPPGKSVVITYQVKIDDPFALGATQISSQGTVHSTTASFTDVVTDDPQTGASNDATITLLDRPDTTVVSLARDASTPTNADSLSWTLTLADSVINLTAANFTLVNSGLGGTPAITGVTPIGGTPATQWTVTASAGTGDGTLGLNLTNDTGLSHDVTNLSFTGEVYTIDRSGPTSTIVVSDTALVAGETSLVTITFNEAASGFTNDDLTVANGTLTAVSSSDGGITWTATLTPDADVTDATNVITLDNTGVTDALGNVGTGTTDSNNYAIDTERPIATIVVADTVLAAGETSLVTITFNEAVTGFTNADLTIANGTLTAVSSSDGGVTWTATLTPTSGITDTTNVITLDNTGVLDAAGNAGTGTTDSNNYIIDSEGPTATIVVADTALAAGETSLVTITFSEVVAGFTNADLTIANGTLSSVSSSDGGITWTATLTPTSGITDASNIITLDNTGVTDEAGNAGSGTTDSNNYAIDTEVPTATIVVADTALAIGETSLVTITFNEAVTGFTNADLTIANGTLSSVSSGDGGVTWTATLTPTAGITDSTNVITLDNTGVTDGAGNAGTGTTDSNNYAIDTERPSATVVVADAALAAGETSLVTITFNEAVTGFTNADLTIANGMLSSVSSSDGGITWTATLTPTSGITDASNIITLDNTGVVDAAGNAGTGTTDSNNYAIDTEVPTATIIVADTALAAGETSLVTITFSEAVTGFTNADLTIANGTLSSVSSSDGGITWTATLTPTSGITDASNIITLDNTGVTDEAGNAGSGTTDSNNYAIDTEVPAATIVVADTALAIGETSLVTITFNEAVTGFTNADLTIANGTLSSVSSGDGGVTWTATLTPTAGITDSTNVITLDNTGVVDAAGNAGTGTTDSNNYAIDTERPTATVVVADTALAAGETSLVTITFSEAVTGFTNADLTVANGTLTAVSSSDGGVTWTATLTPTSGISDASNVITLDNTGVIDVAGNAGTGTTDSNNYSIDTEVPTATIVVADTALAAGETSLVTITFSEAVTGFTNADLTIANGTLSSVSSSDGGITWTATLTPTSGITDASNIITLDNTGVTDEAGNAGSGTTDSNNYAIDTEVPTATIVVADTALAIGETSLVTVTFNEAVTGFTNADLTIANGTLSSVSSSDGGITWTATLTPNSGITDSTNVITLDNTGVVDAAGNAGTGTTDSNNYAIDTERPSATIVVADTELMIGETSLVTITFSEAVTGFTNADLTIENGTLTPVSSSDGGVTWTATFTPTPDLTDASNVITLDNTGVVDAAGNTGLGTTESNNYAITSLSISIVADAASGAEGTGGGNTAFTFTVSRTGSTVGDVMVDYAVTGTADSADFGGALPSGTFTIPDGAVSAVLTIDVSQDSAVEPDENFTVTLSNPTGGYVLITATAASTITNDDAATLSIAKINDGAETSSPSDGLFRITQSATSSTDTVVTYTVGGSATSGSDFTALSGIATIPAGSTTTDIVVPVLGDDLVEGTETVSVTLDGITSSHSSITLGAPLSASLDITDDDIAVVSIAKIEDGSETSTLINGLFRVTQSALSSSDTVVNYTVGGTATSGSDFTALSGSVTITAGTSSADIVLPVLNDDIVEATETVVITLTGFAAADADVSLGATVAASANITDDDTATVSIAKLNDGAESNTPTDGAFRITQSAVSSIDTVINIEITSAATTGSDFTAPVSFAVIAAGATSVDYIIPVLNDNFIETTETVTATLSSLGSHNSGISIAASPDNSASLDITDDDIAASIEVSSGSGQSATVNTAFADPLVAIVKDAGGVALGGASVTFSAPVSGASGSFVASATVVTDANGLATAPAFTANTISGGYTVTASTSGVATPANFTLTNAPGNASEFVVNAPASAIAGEAFNVTVTALDAFGNTATGYAGTVHFTASDSAAILPADSPLVSGVGTFSINLATGGNQTVTATDTINGTVTGVSDAINVSPRADLAITLSDSPDPVNAAGNLTYTVSLTNNGPSAAVSPSVTLPLPAGTTFVSASAPPAWTTTSPAVGGTGTVSFSAASLAAGETAVFTIIAKVDLNIVNDTILSATATAATSTTDPVSANDSATTTTLAKSGADLQITMVDSPDPVIAGTELTYTIELGNNGPLDAENVSIIDTLPVGTSFVSLSVPSGWTATTPAVGAAGSVTITSPLFANAGSATFTLVVKIGSNVANGTTLSNTVAVSSTVIDIAPGNNSSTTETAVTTQSDLTIEITATPDTAPKGSEISYEITVTNNGPSDASLPVVSMPIPTHMTFVSASAPGGWSSTTPAVGATGTVSFSAASLANAASATFTVIAQVNPDAPTGAILTATATASASGVDPVAADNSDTTTSAVGTVEPTVLQIGTSGTPNSQSGLFELTVNVTNTTPLPINGFRLHVDFSAYLAGHPSLRLYNATSPAGSADVYVDYPYPVAMDATVPVKLSFYTSTRTFPNPFAPVLSVETLATSQLPHSDGSGVQPRIVMMAGGNVLLEFPSEVGRWYRVRYSSDMVNWSDSPVPLQAAANRMQWIDSGPPFTNVPPSEAPSRFYRVVEITAP